jgi:hypothetical protein
MHPFLIYIDEPPAKRRKIRELPPIDELSEANHAEAGAFHQDFDMGVDMDIDMGLGMGGNSSSPRTPLDTHHMQTIFMTRLI